MNMYKNVDSSRRFRDSKEEQCEIDFYFVIARNERSE
jgi:hypothetical protein